MAKPVALTAPLSIYVLFHVDSTEGRRLAHALHDWFRLRNDDGDRTEAGLPIWFRSYVRDRAQVGKTDEDAAEQNQTETGESQAPPAPDWQIEPEIRWGEAHGNIVVVLADRHMVADRRWRFALESLCRECQKNGRPVPDRLILPVEVHWSVYQLGFLTAARNAVRVGTPLPDQVQDKPECQEFRKLVDVRARILRRAVTEAIARELVFDRELAQLAETVESEEPETRGGGATPPERLGVFLSHAKGDGLPIAEKLRDRFAALSQLRVWFDANDLPNGYGWSDKIREAAGGLACLISVVTDVYHTRPWCREEVNEACTPRRMKVDGSDNHSIWRVQPTVAVHQAGARWSRSMAQLVEVPTIGWPTQAEQIEDRIADVVDRLLLEILVSHFYRRLAEEVVERAEKTSEGDHVAMLTWVPEPWSLVHVLTNLIDPQGEDSEDFKSIGDDQRIVVAYPGFGLRTLERLELETVARSMVRFRMGPERDTGTNEKDENDKDGEGEKGKQLPRIQLTSQERLEHGQAPPNDPTFKLWVCLSGGGTDEEVEAAGVGMPHADDMFVRLARRLLESGGQIVYGGTLGDLGSNLTKTLIDVARGWTRERKDAKQDRPVHTAAELDKSPFRNYSPWPNTRFIQLQHRADLVGMCEFEMVYPPGRDDDPPPVDSAFLNSAEGMHLYAEALSRMREETGSRTLKGRDEFPLRIVLAGKITNAAGFMPGIAEEVYWALKGKQLPMVLGAFGGCANLLASFLKSGHWPEQLDFAARRHDKALKAILEHAKEEDVAARFRDVKTRLGEFHQELHGTDGKVWPFPEGTREPVLALLDASRPTDILRWVLQVAEAMA